MFEDYYGMSSEEAGLLQALLSGEQGFPTAQPVVAEPVENEQSTPTAQPVQAEPYYPPLDLGDWNIGMVNTGPLNLLSDPGPAYDPNMVYRFDTGNKIGVPNEQGGIEYRNAAPVVFQPGQTYSLTDYNNNVIGTASTPEEMQALIAAADKQAVGGWNLYQGDVTPGTQLFSRSPQDNTLKTVALAGLTAMGAGALGPFIQGTGAIAPGLTGAAATPLGAGLAAAGVNTVGNLATGASLGDALKSGALAGLSSAAMTGLLGGSPNNAANVGDLQAAAIDTADLLTGLGVNPTLAGQIASGPISGIGAVGGVAAPSMGSLVGTDVGSNLIQVVANTGSKLPTSVLSGALNAATGTLSGTNYGDQVFNQTAQQPPADQTLEQQFDTVFNAPTTVYGDVGSNAVANAAAGATGGVVGSAPSTQSPDVVGQNDIVVTNKYTPPTFDSTLAAAVGSVAPTLIDPGITKPTTPTETEKSSLLNDIMKYYSLGSGLLDALGVGQGSTTAPTTPYTSTLGVLPTFGRGQFTPFQGDYETYGQGPEWNFFGGQ